MIVDWLMMLHNWAYEPTWFIEDRFITRNFWDTCQQTNILWDWIGVNVGKWMQTNGTYIETWRCSLVK